MRSISKFILVLTIVGLLTGCGITETEPGPEEGAREWIDAIVNLDGNKMLKHTCLAQRENVQQTSIWSSAFAVLGQMLTGGATQIEGDISDLKFETISRNGDQAELRVYGELRVAVLGSAQAHQVDERWQMVRENDTWRWCGSSSGTLPLEPTRSPIEDESLVTPFSNWLPRPDEVPSYMQLWDAKSETYQDSASYQDDPAAHLARLENWGRIAAHSYYYLNQDGCKTPALLDISVRASMFKTPEGAQQALEWLKSEEAAASHVIAPLELGEDAFQSWLDYESYCNPPDLPLRVVVIVFRRNNAVGEVYVTAVKGAVSEDDMLSQAISLAQIIDVRVSTEN